MISKERYDAIWQKHAPSQDKFEYFLFLQFVQSYFEFRGIKNPMVVEIGVRGGKQALYYKNLLNADYIGIDISPKQADYIIQGDSHTLATVEKLRSRLNGRRIDLLFIDGDHAYASASTDWALYSPLTDHLIALHDINWEIDYYPDRQGDHPSVAKLWQELEAAGHSLVSFKCPGLLAVEDGNGSRKEYLGDPGIGVVIVDRGKPELRWTFQKNRFQQMWGTDGRAYPRLQEYENAAYLK